MGDDIKDEAWCDVVPMDACHIFYREGRGYKRHDPLHQG